MITDYTGALTAGLACHQFNAIVRLLLARSHHEKEIHLHHFPTFDSLKDKVEEARLHFKDLKNEVLSLFGFYKNLVDA